jgi:membrane glycosyltransferase
MSSLPVPSAHATPTGAAHATRAAMAWRRASFATLVLATIAGLLGLMAYTLGANGLDAADWAMLLTFGLTLPWTAVGFWNAVIGLVLMLGFREPAAIVAPAVLLGRDETPIDTATAVLVCIRNEDPQRLERNLDAMLTGLTHSGAAAHLQFFLLSDSDIPAIVEAEQAVAAALERRFEHTLAVTYRRREHNAGYKAGNIRDFCDRWGAQFDFAIVLDADSVMSPAVMTRLIRVMQADPRLGIVQTLVVGLPSSSAFARVFQFGMRLGMRSYTLGSAWWQGDCGPYWGHNAIIRLAPFIAHCELPPLPGSGPLAGAILSHDQVEAVLMRRAGYEVRVLPVEDGSWEENPPTLLEFVRRDLRWCQGNMQYWRLLALPGLRPVGRCQLVLAILMFVGSPAWLALVLTASFRHLLVPTDGPVFRFETGLMLLAIVLGMVFAPKIATVFTVLASRRRRHEFGGSARFMASVGLETLFSAILAPIMAVTHTVFLASLAFGRTIGWTAQVRDGHRVPFDAAASRLWPQSLLGALMAAWFALRPPEFALLGAPFYGPLLVAIPFAMLTAWPAFGEAMARWRVAAIPEESAPPQELLRLGLPALTLHRPAAGPVASPT